jgi:BlaI family penicillinase repressor
MEVLWRNGASTARAITDELNVESPIAHSTVQTLLRKMEAKGALRHFQQERAFVFKPLVERSQVAESAAADILSRVFHGSVFDLVSHLLGHEELSPDELKRLRALIDSYSEHSVE